LKVSVSALTFWPELELNYEVSGYYSVATVLCQETSKSEAILPSHPPNRRYTMA